MHISNINCNTDCKGNLCPPGQYCWEKLLSCCNPPVFGDCKCSATQPQPIPGDSREWRRKINREEKLQADELGRARTTANFTTSTNAAWCYDNSSVDSKCIPLGTQCPNNMICYTNVGLGQTTKCGCFAGSPGTLYGPPIGWTKKTTVVLSSERYKADLNQARNSANF